MPGGKGNVGSPHWFKETFGFWERDRGEDQGEDSFEKTRGHFDFDCAGGVLRSRANGASFHVGPFEMLSLEELRFRAATAADVATSVGGLTFANIVGDAQTLHRDPANAGAVFQVASQFNCLEMKEPGARPENGVTGYYNDATQGPACALACQAATVYRNYFANGTGQSKGRQLDGLSDIGEMVGNEKHGYWRMANGYSLPAEQGGIAKLSGLIKKDSALEEQVRARLRIGIRWDTEVTNKDHRVCQTFSSAVPVSYAKAVRSQDWMPFACAILDATFEASLAAAATLAVERQDRVKVFLTAVGGGAFGNRSLWIADAIEKALRAHAESPLDVMLVHFGAATRGAYVGLEKGRKTGKAPKGGAGAAAAAAAPAGAARRSAAAPPAAVGAAASSSSPAGGAPGAAPGAAEIAAAFAKFDLNGDGVINLSEFCHVMKSLDDTLTDQEIQTLLAAADSNGDGEVHYAEFAAWVFNEDAALVAKVLQ